MNMTYANYFNLSAGPSLPRYGSEKGKLLIAALLAGLLLTTACSKEKSKPAASGVVTPPVSTASIQPSLPQVSAPALTSAPATHKPTVKRAARTHSSMVTYKDDTYGISFGYPRKYGLKTGEDLNSDSGVVALNFVQPGGLAAVSVELPDKAYPGTDLTSAAFQVNVHKGLSEAECKQFATPQNQPDDKNAVQPSQVQIGSMDFAEVENITGESTKQADTKYYHVFEGGACYEFALGLTTAWDGNEDGVTMVDREEVFRRLEKILAGVKITPPAAPAVASDAPVTPPVQSEVVK